MFQYFFVISISFLLLRWSVRLKRSNWLKKLLVIDLVTVFCSFALPIYVNGYNLGVFNQAVKGSFYHLLQIITFLFAIIVLIKSNFTKNTLISAMFLIEMFFKLC